MGESCPDNLAVQIAANLGYVSLIAFPEPHCRGLLGRGQAGTRSLDLHIPSGRSRHTAILQANRWAALSRPLVSSLLWQVWSQETLHKALMTGLLFTRQSGPNLHALWPCMST